MFTSILNNFDKTQVLKSSKNILITDVAGIKVDFVNYQYPLLQNPLDFDSINMVSKKDIAGRGSKKYFIDLYFLLKDFFLKQMLGFYKEKYLTIQNLWLSKVCLILKKQTNNHNQKCFKFQLGKL